MKRILVGFAMALALIAAGCDTRGNARSELDAMGIAYTENAFVQKARDGDDRGVRLFLRAGMDGNRPALQRALMVAASRGKARMVEELIANGADVNPKAKNGYTALMNAANVDVARVLIAHGADVNAKTMDGYTALMSAAMKGKDDVERLLIAHGAKR